MKERGYCRNSISFHEKRKKDRMSNFGKSKKIRLNIEFLFKFKKEKGENDEKNSSHIFF